jgi:hypothetical protein
VHVKTLQGVCSSEESFEDSEVKAQEEQRFYTRSEAQVRSSQRRKKTKVEAFENLEILPSLGRKCARSSGGSTTAVRSAGEKIWTVGFHVQEELRRSAQKGGDCGPLDLFRNPVSRWIGRRCSEFSLWRSAQENGSGPSDLEQIPVSRRMDRSCTRFTIGTSAIGISGV